MRVACVGAGPAGLLLALLLKRQDPAHALTVYERSAPGESPGWGVVFWDDLLQALRAADPPLAAELARAAFRWNDQVVAVAGAPPFRQRGHGYAIRRERLLALLAGRAEALGVGVQRGHEVRDPAQLAGADLVVACDGAGSALRARHAGHFGTRVRTGRNRYLWLGTPRVFASFTFALVPTPAGWIWFHAYGFEPGMSTLIVECAPGTWRGLGLDRLDAAQGLALLERLFAHELGGQPLLSPGPPQQPLPWRCFRTLTNETWRRGPLVLAGDAAHTTHFAIGSGTRLAMLDAIALAGALGDARGPADLDAALARYERERKAALLQPQQEARLSAAWFEALPRYAALPPRHFAALLLRRRSPLMPRLPPRLYYAVSRLAGVPALRRLRAWTRGRPGQGLLRPLPRTA